MTGRQESLDDRIDRVVRRLMTIPHARPGAAGIAARLAREPAGLPVRALRVRVALGTVILVALLALAVGWWPTRPSPAPIASRATAMSTDAVPLRAALTPAPVSVPPVVVDAAPAATDVVVRRATVTDRVPLPPLDESRSLAALEAPAALSLRRVGPERLVLETMSAKPLVVEALPSAVGGGGQRR